MSQDPESSGAALVASGKGILAADETVPTLTQRFATLWIPSTEQSRRTFREMLFTAPEAAEFISGVIMHDETIRQKSAGGMPLIQVLSSQGIIAGIKVDTGAKPLAGSPGESVTEEWMRDQRILTAPPIAVSGATTDRHERPISSSAGPAATALCQLYDIEPGRR